jgi:hypothetical protein
MTGPKVNPSLRPICKALSSLNVLEPGPDTSRTGWEPLGAARRTKSSARSVSHQTNTTKSELDCGVYV